VFIRLQKSMSILMLHTHTQFIAIILIHLDAPVIIRLEAVKLGEMECKWG